MTDEIKRALDTETCHNCEKMLEAINDIKQSVYSWGSRDSCPKSIEVYSIKVDWIFERANKVLAALVPMEKQGKNVYLHAPVGLLREALARLARKEEKQ